MANDLPTDFIPINRDRLTEIGRNAWLIRHRQANPDSPLDITEKSFPGTAVAAISDMLVPFMANTVFLARAYLIRNTFGDRLDRRVREVGLARLPATGSTGYIIADRIADFGAMIDNGTELLHPPTGKQFTVVNSGSKLYADGDLIALAASDLGPDTNLGANTALVFVNPPAGVTTGAKVFAQSDGQGNLLGLTGGREAETDIELQDRFIDRQANPPASGNSAEIILEVERTVGIPVEKAFVIPAIRGPGTTCVLFTVRPNATGSRIPSATQRAEVLANLTNIFPADFGILLGQLRPYSVAMSIRVLWKQGGKSWADANPWPAAGLVSPGPTPTWALVYVDPLPTAPTANGCRLTNRAADPVTQVAASLPDPAPGQTIAFYDLPSSTFKRKRLATVTVVTAGLSWDVTFDNTASASDVYTPIAYQMTSPWSDNLALIPATIAKVFRALGPGEQVATFLDPGLRQRRYPRSPDEWVSVIGNADVVTAVKGATVVADVVVDLPTTPYATPRGVPGVFSNLFQLGDLAVSYQ